jgi:hypothetical protein
MTSRLRNKRSSKYENKIFPFFTSQEKSPWLYRPHFVSLVSFCFFSSHQTMMANEVHNWIQQIPPDKDIFPVQYIYRLVDISVCTQLGGENVINV